MKNHYKGSFSKGETIWPVARVPAPDADGLLVAGDVTNYDRYVYDLTAGERTGAPATALQSEVAGTTADVMETALANDGWWHGGGNGYTFRDGARTSSSSVGVVIADPQGGHVYRIVYYLNTTAYGRITLVWDMTCEGHEAIIS